MPVPLQQSGGGGTTLTGTGIARNTGACTELSGDVTTSGSNAATIKTNVALAGNPTTTTQSQADNSTKVATTAYVDTGLGTKQATLTGTGLARNTGASTELSGDVTTSGSNAATVVKVNGASVPVSATILGSNGSSQLIDNSANLANIKIATLSLTAAQIKALFTTPLQIIATPGAGLAINIWYVVWNYIAGGTGYSNVTGQLQLANPALSFTLAAVVGTTLGMGNASTNGVSFQTGVSSQTTDANYVNTARSVWISTANPTLGNGTITVKAFYTIDTVS